MDNNKLLHEDITDKIIAAFYQVYNELGYGFLEKVYEEAMIIELTEKGLTTAQQLPIEVWYRGNVIGQYYADLCVENKVIIEIKAAQSLTINHEAQLLNYLKATEIEVGMLMNFGPKPQFIRRVLTNNARREGARI